MDITKQYSRHNDEDNNRYYNNEKSTKNNSNKHIGKKKKRHGIDDSSSVNLPIHPISKQNNQKLIEKELGKEYHMSLQNDVTETCTHNSQKLLHNIQNNLDVREISFKEAKHKSNCYHNKIMVTKINIRRVTI